MDDSTNHKDQPALISDIVHGGVEFPARMTLAMILVRGSARENASLAMFRDGFQRAFTTGHDEERPTSHDGRKGYADEALNAEEKGESSTFVDRPPFFLFSNFGID